MQNKAAMNPAAMAAETNCPAADRIVTKRGARRSESGWRGVHTRRVNTDKKLWEGSLSTVSWSSSWPGRAVWPAPCNNSSLAQGHIHTHMLQGQNRKVEHRNIGFKHLLLVMQVIKITHIHCVCQELVMPSHLATAKHHHACQGQTLLQDN